MECLCFIPCAKRMKSFQSGIELTIHRIKHIRKVFSLWSLSVASDILYSMEGKKVKCKNTEKSFVKSEINSSPDDVKHKNSYEMQSRRLLFGEQSVCHTLHGSFMTFGFGFDCFNRHKNTAKEVERVQGRQRAKLLCANAILTVKIMWKKAVFFVSFFSVVFV